MDSASADGMTDRRRRIILFAACAGSFMLPLLSTMLTLALPAIGEDFTVSAYNLGWLQTVYLLTSVVILVPASAIIDRTGYKISSIAGCLLVAVSSILSVFAPDYIFLLAMRALSAIGSSFVIVAATAVIAASYPANKKGTALGIHGATIYVGLTLGPVIGGMLTSFAGWPAVYIILIPLALAAAAAFWIVLDNDRGSGNKIPFDKTGAVIYSVSLLMLMYGISSLDNIFSGVLAAAGLILFIFFIRYEKKQKYPVLHVKLFTGNRHFAYSIYAALLNYGCGYGSVFLISLYLQSVGQLTAAEAGLVIFVQPLIQVILSPVTGRLSDILDTRKLVTAGMAIEAVGIFMLGGLSMQADMFYLLIVQILLGTGMALFSAPNVNAVMNGVEKSEYSSASALLSFSRQTGMICSMSICMTAISLIVGNTELLRPEMYETFLTAVRAATFGCAILALFGIYFSWCRGEKPNFE